MSKLLSFWLLVAVIVVLGVLFFRVISGFLVPLFLAAVLVVIFNPLQKWMLIKLKGRRRSAAALTTVLVMSIVLVPIGLLVTFATLEGRQIVQQMDKATLISKLHEMRTRFGLDMKNADKVRRIESLLQEVIDRNVLVNLDASESAELSLIDYAQVAREADKLGQELQLPWPVDPTLTYEQQGENPFDSWVAFANAFKQSKSSLDRLEANPDSDSLEFVQQVTNTHNAFREFKTALLGGSFRATLTELANPTPEEVSQYSERIVEWSQNRLVTFGGATLEFAVKLVIGIVILIVAVYFFLLDGPAMLTSFKSLSPLDDRYEEELITEFDRISRAVVVAALLSAVVQGILAGFGYWLAGLESVFLLTLLTMLFALIPFVGTSLVWAPCCAYLYVFEGRLVPAILLAIFGVVVVSQADNLIKPFVLHGQSNIHPLMALLSILGGVATLGPIGILIGPMVVAFLQTLLKILQREMTQMDDRPEPSPES